jgi:CRISPR-associated protein Cas1
VLGQYVFAGEKTHYGLGRYVIEECYAAEADPFRPARTLLSRLEPELLEEALDNVIEHSTAPGVDGNTPEAYSEARDQIAEQVAAELRADSYRPSPLRGFLAAKDNARVRALTVPTVRDRMVQRAACELLGPAIETLLEDCSYAYRKGFSRAGAVRAIERAYEDGYRHVLDADIESFFDAVDWTQLLSKLDALFPFEPLVRLVEEWVKVPVVFERSVIQRERGLPQGAPVSPLLANLYLDEFDEELLGRDYRLVRYGDDFVVLCRDLETAQRAREEVRAKLAELGLKLSEEKTSIRSFDEGFTYLGYLFCRALVLEKKRGRDAVPADITSDSIPSASWLVQVPFERIRSLMLRQGGQSGRVVITPDEPAPPVEVVPLAPRNVTAPAGVVLNDRRPFYVTSFDTSLRKEGDALVACVPGKDPLTIPVGSLSHVVCYGRVRVTVPVLLALADQGVPTYFCRRSGELKGVFGAPPADWELWMAQAKLAGDEASRVSFAREIVAAKLHNYAALVVRFELVRAPEVAEELRGLEAACVNKTTLEAMNGLEGRGAAAYFGAMRETLHEEWAFCGRRTRPPSDPVNALLSFGYTLLYYHLSTALLAAGLNPRIGLYHRERGTYHALACDMQEEFRHLVDAQVWAMINRREVKPSDFHASEDGRFPCLLGQEPRRKFIATFERRLSTEFTPPSGETTTYRAFMDAQVRQLKELFGGRINRYRPLRSRGAAGGDREEA